MKFFCLVSVIALAANLSLGETRNILSSGSVQSGSFELRGSASGVDTSTWTYPDTVVIDGSVRIISFTEVLSARLVMWYGPRRYWLFLENSSGPIGYSASYDSVWSDAPLFRTGTLNVDTLKYIPDFLPAYADQLSPSNLTGTHVGFQAGTRNYGGEGYPNSFSLTADRNRIVYFHYATSGGRRYGKLAIADMKVRVSALAPVADGPRVELERTTVRFTLADSSSVTFGPSRILSARTIRNAGQKSLIWSDRHGVLIRDAKGQFYSLSGKSVGGLPVISAPD